MSLLDPSGERVLRDVVGHGMRLTIDHQAEHARALVKAVAREIGEGLGHLWSDRRLRAIAGAAATVNFFGLMIFALLVVFLTRVHDFSPVMIAVKPLSSVSSIKVLRAAPVGPQCALIQARSSTKRSVAARRYWPRRSQ